MADLFGLKTLAELGGYPPPPLRKVGIAKWGPPKTEQCKTDSSHYYAQKSLLRTVGHCTFGQQAVQAVKIILT